MLVKNQRGLTPQGSLKQKIYNIIGGTQSGEVATYEQLDPISVLATQSTSITTGVTINAKKGVITTQSATAGAAGATPQTFTVTNNTVSAGKVVKAFIVDYAGTIATNGNPFIIVDNITTNAFDIIISNAHGTNALSGVLKIAFEVCN